MKKITFLVIAILSCTVGFSQSFNYQAVVRNSTGDPVANQPIGVQVQILEGVAPDNLVYTETHTVTSNAQGVISLAIGTGTTSDTFSTINWSQQNQWIGIAVDITGGTTYTSIGTTKLQQVPYALYAANSGDKTFDTTNNITSNAPGDIATDNFVFGSTQLDNIPNDSSDNARFFFNKNKAAFRLGFLDDSSEGGPDAGTAWDDENLGFASIAMGSGSIVKGHSGISFGAANVIESNSANTITIGSSNNVNNVGSSYAFGETNTITSSGSDVFGFAFGANNTLSTGLSFGLGYGLIANSRGQMVLGLYNEATTPSPGGLLATDPYFVIGNGTDFGVRSNALVMHRNGNTTLNGALTIDGDNAGAGTPYTLPAQDGSTNQVMSTDGAGNVSWIDATAGGSFSTSANVTSNANGSTATDDFVFGSTQLDDDPNIPEDSLRMFFDKSQGAIRAGRADNEWDASNVGQYSAAFGSRNTASGFSSTAFGEFNTTSAPNSTAMGRGNQVQGSLSTAIGSGNITTGSTSTAIGTGLTVESLYQISIGGYNTSSSPTVDAFTIHPDDRLLVVGNGTADANRSDALTILKNGNTTLNGQLTIDGDNQGAGQAFTLPAQDGTVNQIMSTDGAGNVSWTNLPATPSVSFSTTNNVTSNANGTIATDDFVFGSTQLDDIENNATDDVKMYFDKSKGSFRAGTALDSGGDAFVWNPINAGDFSVAMGRYSLAQGTAATAFGTGNNAGGENAFAAGFQNLASRPSTVALGARNSVSGYYAVGIGRGTQATSYGQHTVGVFSEGFISNDAAYIATDPLFVVGNGVDDANRSNALVMTKNGNTQLNGSLTIDGDNVGSGASYTLPAQDGAANQVMTTDGAGNVSWSVVSGNDADADPTNEIELPTGGTNGQILNTNGSGVYSWVNDAVNDADNDPTNEIELPAGGTNGQILNTNGSGVYSWVNDAVNDADNDPTNEIELPAGGTSGQILNSDGAGGSQWSSNVSAATVTTPALTVSGLPSFCADLSGTLVLSGAGGFVQVPSWRTSDAAVTNLHDNGNHFNEATGAFTAPVNGFYFFSAQVRFDGVNSGFFRLLVGVEGALSLENGLHAISQGDATTNFHTLSVSGVLRLSAGDKVFVNAISSEDNAWNLQSESGFSGYLISRF